MLLTWSRPWGAMMDLENHHKRTSSRFGTQLARKPIDLWTPFTTEVPKARSLCMISRIWTPLEECRSGWESWGHSWATRCPSSSSVTNAILKVVDKSKSKMLSRRPRSSAAFISMPVQELATASKNSSKSWQPELPWTKKNPRRLTLPRNWIREVWWTSEVSMLIMMMISLGQKHSSWDHPWVMTRGQKKRKRRIASVDAAIYFYIMIGILLLCDWIGKQR